MSLVLLIGFGFAGANPVQAQSNYEPYYFGTFVTGLNLPRAIALDAAHNIYVADIDHTIRKITPAGVVSTFADLAGVSGSADGMGSAARFSSPMGVMVDNDGNVYVSDALNFTIRKITADGMVTTFAGSAGAQGTADGIGGAARFRAIERGAVDSANNLYVPDHFTIRKITPEGVVSTFAGLAGSSGTADGIGNAARFDWPRGIAVDGADNLYVSEYIKSTIRKIGPAGVVTTFAGLADQTGSTDGVGSAARFYSPKGLGTDSANNVYVADYGNNTIRKISPAGVVTTLGGLVGSNGPTDGVGAAARFDKEEGIAVDSDNTLYIADGFNNTVRIGSEVSKLLKVVSLTPPTVNGVHLDCLGVPNAVNRLEAAPDLSANGFTALGSLVADEFGQFHYDDVNVGTKKFYRVSYP